MAASKTMKNIIQGIPAVVPYITGHLHKHKGWGSEGFVTEI